MRQSLHKYVVIGWLLTWIVLGQMPSFGGDLETVAGQYSNAVRRAEEQYRQNLDTLRQQYVQALDGLITRFTKAGNLDDALAVREEKQRVQKNGASGSSNAYCATPTNTTLTPTVQAIPTQSTLFANCDDGFTLCVNGTPVANGQGSTPAVEVVTVKRGDIITVKVMDTGVQHGFACVLKRPDAEHIATNTRDWYSYLPQDKEKWYDTKLATKKTRASLGSNQEWKASIEFKSNVKCEAIWEPTPSGVAYLMYEVR